MNRCIAAGRCPCAPKNPRGSRLHSANSLPPSCWLPRRLNHPNPYNPFRTRVDENGIYVAPSMQRRQRALEMGLPLYGAMGN